MVDEDRMIQMRENVTRCVLNIGSEKASSCLCTLIMDMNELKTHSW